MLSCPGVRRSFELIYDRVIASAGGVIDGEIAVLPRYTGTAVKDGEWRRRRGSVAHPFTPRSTFVVFHRVARRMNDHHTQTAGGADHLIHPRRHQADALRRHAAGMRVPHIADDNRRAGDR